MDSNGGKRLSGGKVGIYSILFFTQLCLLLSRPTFYWPEMYLFPHLIRHGQIPYKDFFDHHGFFLSFLLSPLTTPPTFTFFDVFFFIIQSLNLILVITILGRKLRPVPLFFFGLLYMLLNYSFTENRLWYESVITTFFLIIFFLLEVRPFHLKGVLLGISLTFATFIKPPALIAFAPIFFKTKNFGSLIPLFLGWGGVVIYYGANGALSQLITGLFSFNSYLLTHNPYYPMPGELYLFFISLSIVLGCMILMTLSSRRISRLVLPLTFLVISLIFIRLAFGKEHLTPFITFYGITLVYTFSSCAPRLKFFAVFLLGGFFFLVTGFALQSYQMLSVREASVLNLPKNKEVINLFTQYPVRTSEDIFIWGDLYELYYLLDSVPPTHYPIAFPLIERFFPDYYTSTIDRLVSQKTRFVVVEKSPHERYTHFPLLAALLAHAYTPIRETSSAIIYMRRHD